MLYEFLENNRIEILELCKTKTKMLAGFRRDSQQLNDGLPLFFDQLINTLVQKQCKTTQDAMLSDAAIHGNEFLTLGYSLSHVVHSYGSMCQAITELATQKNANISPEEFNILNGCLDIAIASAVSEFQFRSNAATEQRETKHLGFLAHELRNALSSVTLAHEMIKAGIVGSGGSTANVLELNLVRMRNLIDRSLSEVRMRADADLFIEKFRLADLFEQITLTARIDAKKKSQILSVEVDPQFFLEADRQFVLTAVSNLIQNAIKYTKSGGSIHLKGHHLSDRVFIEVQDECGGIPNEKLKTLFDPFIMQSSDRSGLGLGLTISQKAIHLNQGTITVKNQPGSGCTFVIEIPNKVTPPVTPKSVVPGIESVQPDFKRKP